MHIYNAELLQDFAGGRAGDTVSVVLDLTCRGVDAIHIWPADRSSDTGSVFLPVQLLIGQMFADAAALDGFLKPEAAE
jgi:hypothetical protein